MLSPKDFAPVVPTPSPALERKRISPMGPPDDDDLPKAMARPRIPHVPPNNEETSMPRGVYDRSKAKPRAAKANKAAASAPDAAKLLPEPPSGAKPRRKKRAAVATRRKATRRARPTPQSGPSFGVWDDGSVQIDTPDCKGRLPAEVARNLCTFIERLKGGA